MLGTAELSPERKDILTHRLLGPQGGEGAAVGSPPMKWNEDERERILIWVFIFFQL